MGYVLSILMNALRTWLLTKLWDSFFTERERFLEHCSSLKRLQVLTDGTKWSRKMTSETGFLMDSGKILSETSKTCLTGKRFYDILLKQYHLQMEML